MGSDPTERQRLRDAPALSPPLTTGQVDLLRMDSVASGTLPGLQDLNIQPKAVEEVVPTYIRRPRASEPD
jgi:NADH dehydrogenase